MYILAPLQAFILTLGVGFWLGIIFHFYQLLVDRPRLRNGLLYICDLLLWAILLWLVFILLLLINQGELRGYIFIALAVGIAIYFKFLSPACRRPLLLAANAITAVINKLRRRVRYVLTRLYQAWFKRRHRHSVEWEEEG